MRKAKPIVVFLSYPRELLIDARGVFAFLSANNCNVVFDDGEQRRVAAFLEVFPIFNKLVPLVHATLDFKLREEILTSDCLVYISTPRPPLSHQRFDEIYGRHLAWIARRVAPPASLVVALLTSSVSYTHDWLRLPAQDRSTIELVVRGLLYEVVVGVSLVRPGSEHWQAWERFIAEIGGVPVVVLLDASVADLTVQLHPGLRRLAVKQRLRTRMVRTATRFVDLTVLVMSACLRIFPIYLRVRYRKVLDLLMAAATLAPAIAFTVLSLALSYLSGRRVGSLHRPTCRSQGTEMSLGS
jgi:hypothetical protein